MSRGTSSFSRKKPTYKQTPTVLVLCEDSKSSKKYIEDASLHFRAHIRVLVTHCGKTDPLGIINEAIKRKREFERIYCVIDRDGHLNFTAALHAARAHPSINVIASYPCFEFWYLLHFGYCRKPFTAVGKTSSGARLLKDLKRVEGMEQYDKGSNSNVFESLLGEPFETARGVSPRVLAEALETQQMNPSTEVHLLINQLEELGTLQKTN